MNTESRTATTAHTPGPWRSHGAGGEIHGNSRVIATMTWCSGMGAEDEANAHLVAAAPDMLAALQLVANDVRSGSLPTNIQNAILAAIAKAVGDREGDATTQTVA